MSTPGGKQKKNATGNTTQEQKGASRGRQVPGFYRIHGSRRGENENEENSQLVQTMCVKAKVYK